MNIFKYAMQMEKDGQEFYESSARQAEHKGLKTILNMLADEEGKHYRAVEEMQTKMVVMAETTILIDAQNVFARIRESGEVFNFNSNSLDVYIKALDIEKLSREFYIEKADEVEEEYQRDLFFRLAAEEQKHYLLLDNIIDFVSQPQQWLENAEFCHLQDY